MTPREFIEVFDTVAEAPGGIERLRELVLQLAVRGKLVHQDADEEPASVLLERIADEKFRLFGEGKLRMPKPLHPIATEEAPFEIPDQWEWVRLGDIANSRLGKMLDKSKNKGPYRRYLRNANVQWFRFDLSDVLELRLEDTELEEYSVKENDLIVCEGGEPGRAAICGPDVDGMVFQKALHRVRPWCGISTWYLAYLLRCDTWSQRINTLFTGATIKHLTGKALATHMVPLPPLSEQYRIVAKIDELMRLIDRLAAARRSREAVRTAGRDSALASLRNAATPEEVGTAWTRVAERMDDLFTAPADLTPLREAVLQLVVRGRLVPQDEEEEPAAVLLYRIAEERAKLVKEKKIRVSKQLFPVSQHEASFEVPQSWMWIRLGSLYHLEALTKLFEVLPTDENTSDVEKGFMEITSSLPADSKPTELVQPCQRSFHHPPIDAQAAAVGLPSPSQHRADAPLTQGAPMGLRIIGPIPLHPIRPTTRAADPTGHRGYAIHQRQQLRHIMPMGPRHPRRQRHPLGIGDYMVFATGFAAVRRIGTGVRPPPTARTEALSTTARDQSIRSAALSRFNRI